MTNAPFPAPDSPWTHWYRRALPAYWLALFCGTHLPRLDLGVRIRSSDKLVHAAAYALLAFLFWRFAEALGQPLSGRFVWIAAGCLALYAALDEYLQAFVGRSPDFGDWLANLGGLAVVLAALEWQRRRRK